MQGFTVMIAPSSQGGRGSGILLRNAAGIGADAVNFMTIVAKGLVAVAMPLSRACALDLPPYRGAEVIPGRPIMLANVEAYACDGTGISAAERAMTLRLLGSLTASPADFVTPGHIIVTVVPDTPRCLGDAPVLSEVAMAYSARVHGSVAIAWSDILDDHGEVASAATCRTIAARHGIPVVVADASREIAANDDGWCVEQVAG